MITEVDTCYVILNVLEINPMQWVVGTLLHIHPGGRFAFLNVVGKFMLLYFMVFVEGTNIHYLLLHLYHLSISQKEAIFSLYIYYTVTFISEI